MLIRVIHTGWRRLSALPLIRRLKTRRPVEGLARPLRHGASVHETFRFASRELLRRGGVHGYRLRDGGGRVFVRHDGRDSWVLHEVFGLRAYELPAPVQAALDETPAPRVLDVGGHVGMFSLFITRRYPGAHVTAIEADVANASVYERCGAENSGAQPWRLIHAAAANAPGRATFAGGLGERSHLVTNGGPGGAAVEAVDVFDYLAGIDLLKLDIEGGEWAILLDERFAAMRPRAVALEYHDLQCPSGDPRATATSRLEELGYDVEHLPEASLSREVGMLWAWQQPA